MRIDRRHRPYLLATLAVGAAGAGLLAIARRSGAATPGGTGPGLALGAAAAVLVLGAVLLGARRRFLQLPLGTVAGWLRAHLWIGLGAFVLAILHGGLSLGGPLTTSLVIVLAAAVGSGVLGAVLQHVLPGELGASAPPETVEDPTRALARARRDAYAVVWAACGAAPDDGAERDAVGALLGEPVRPPRPGVLRPSGTIEGQDGLSRFYRSVVLPFLRAPGAAGSPLARAADAALVFDAEAAAIGAALRVPLDDLAALCEAARRARRELGKQRWMHAWLLFHVPLSMALLVLLAAHVALALRY
jgi:hypothetical protein